MIETLPSSLRRCDQVEDHRRPPWRPSPPAARRAAGCRRRRRSCARPRSPGAGRRTAAPPARRCRGMLIPISSSALRASRFISALVRNGIGRSTLLAAQEHVVVDGQLVDQREVLEDGVDRRGRGRRRRSWARSPRPCSHIDPLSCFWKPQRILISVDLPAPLSPSRPSTSPLRRCRLTSRSATVGPKRLAMCSTRSTSSSRRCRRDDPLAGEGVLSHGRTPCARARRRR